MNAVTTPQRIRISVDRFEKMIDTGVLSKDDRIELIDGDMINVPWIGPEHSFLTAQLTKQFVLSVGDSAIVSPGGSVRLGNYSMPQPDLMLLIPRTDGYRRQRPTPPDVLLLVEISDSSLAYDQSTKRALYARFGVPEYWVVDVRGERVHVYREPVADGYAQVIQCAAADIVSPRALPAVQIRVGALFE